MQTQKILLYVFPIIFAISGISFPLGVMFYWLTSNFWTMGQQFVVIRNMPTPGSVAHTQRAERLAKRGKTSNEPTLQDLIESAEAAKPQRVQPVSKARAKKNSAPGAKNAPTNAAKPDNKPAAESADKDNQ